MQGFCPVLVVDDLIRVGELEVAEDHLVEAHVLQFQHGGGDPALDTGRGRVQPEAALAVQPKACPAGHVDAAGHVGVAVHIVLEGGDPGDHIVAFALELLDEFIHLLDGGGSGLHGAGNGSGVEEGAVAPLHIHQDGGARRYHRQVVHGPRHVLDHGGVV